MKNEGWNQRNIPRRFAEYLDAPFERLLFVSVSSVLQRRNRTNRNGSPELQVKKIIKIG